MHRVLKFNQKARLKSCINMKTRLRKNAKADCEKIFLKLRNKSVFERIRENLR